MKTKGQQPLVAKLELLAFCDFRGGLAERPNAAGLHPADGACTTVQGFESLTRRQNSNYTPAEVRASTGAKSAQPKPYGPRKSIIRLLAARLKEIRSDLPQLPDRMQEVREASRWNAAVSLLPMR